MTLSLEACKQLKWFQAGCLISWPFAVLMPAQIKPKPSESRPPMELTFTHGRHAFFLGMCFDATLLAQSWLVPYALQICIGHGQHEAHGQFWQTEARLGGEVNPCFSQLFCWVLFKAVAHHIFYCVCPKEFLLAIPFNHKRRVHCI